MQLPMGTFYRYRPASFGFGIGMTRMVKILLILNTALFLVTAKGFLDFPLYQRLFLALTPALAIRGMVWQLVTYMFFHGGLGHILFNMLTLWMFGTALEQTWGPRRFLRYYLTCGVGAGLMIVLAALISGAPRDFYGATIGASGALFGLFVAFGIMFPNVPVLVFLLFPMPAKYFVMLMGVINLYMMRSGADTGISYIGHLGGLLVGFLYLKAGTLSSRRAWDLRGAYDRWKRRRLRKKFEVYMRKHGEGPGEGQDRWIQ